MTEGAATPAKPKAKAAGKAKPKKPSTRKQILDCMKLETGGKSSVSISRQKISKMVGCEKNFLLTKAIKALVKSGELCQDKGSFRLPKKEAGEKKAGAKPAKKGKPKKPAAAKKPKAAAAKKSPAKKAKKEKKPAAAKPAAKKASPKKKPAAKAAKKPAKKAAKKASPKKKPAPKK